jgi:hypothetical protein
MGLFSNFFKKKKTNAAALSYLRTLDGYSPVFTNAPESIYEMELTRACVHKFAETCSKLKPVVSGAAGTRIEKILQRKPNPCMTASQFLYKAATILEMNNTVFIIPLYADEGETIINGYYPLMPAQCEPVEYGGETYLRFLLRNGEYYAIELSRVGIVNKFTYSNDFFGESNDAFRTTMELIHSQNEGIVNAIQNSASIRFMAKIMSELTDADLKENRDRFAKINLSSENKSQLMIFDGSYDEVKPVTSTPFIVNAAQMKLINDNVFSYFGTNQAILENSYTEDQWNAYYEGKIEAFALQLSQAMTNMTFSNRQMSSDNEITFSANRLQYASNTTKLNIATQLLDRGIMSINDVRDIFQLSPVENGDTLYIRGEYKENGETA